MKRILTYGTFDLLHYGHIRILKRAKELGDYLVVALSTDEFNATKGKKAYHSYETRKKMLETHQGFCTFMPCSASKFKRFKVRSSLNLNSFRSDEMTKAPQG